MDQAEQALRERLRTFAAEYEGRYQLVRDAHAYGLSKTDIHRITGLARTTIDRIVGTVPTPQTSGPGSSSTPPAGAGLTTNRPEGDQQ